MAVNIGVIGMGKMGILHSGILNSLQDVRVKAICESDRLVARAARSLLPETMTLYNDHKKMLESEELDAVLITTPISSHVPLIEDLSRADSELSVFVEKPLAASREQARAACQAVKRITGIHMVGFQKRFSPVFQKAKKYIGSGALGELMFFRAHSYSSDVLQEGRSWRFRSGTGGVLLDLAPHLLDLLLWMFGEASPKATIRRRLYSREVDDYVHALISFNSGLTGHVDLCWSIRNVRLPEISIEVHGRDGMLIVTDDFVKIQVNSKAKEGLGGVQVWYKQSFETSVPFLLAEPEFTLEDVAFISAVNERTMPDLNFFEAAKVNELMERILEATE